MFWGTYKATMKRDGAYHSPTYGEIDMNQGLTDPIYTKIAVSWNRLFTVEVNQVIAKVETALRDLVCGFMLGFKKYLKSAGVAEARSLRVEEHLHKDLLGVKLPAFVNECKTMVQDKQKDANRMMTPEVREQMKLGYQTAAGESGTGS